MLPVLLAALLVPLPGAQASFHRVPGIATDSGANSQGSTIASGQIETQSLPTRLLRGLGSDETLQILSHGPWPPKPAFDAGNAQSGDPHAIALGQRLFFDKRLSANGQMACATCHQPAKAFADAKARSAALKASGVATLDRNSPSLWNAVHERWYGWDGAADSLWSQSIRPLLDAREMATNASTLARVIDADAALSCRWKLLFGAPAGTQDADTVLVNTAKALGAFTATLVSGRSPFDRFRDALAHSDAQAAARYPADALRGLRLFVGRGNCVACHSGPMFSNGEFGDIGVPFFVRPGVVDPGRHVGIQALRASPYNLLGKHSDAGADDPSTTKTRHVQLQHRNFGEFKVPSLRNVALTAPYMHDGQKKTLADVVRHYSELNLDRLHADGERVLEPLKLTPRESADLMAFLRSLNDPNARNWKAPATPACPTQAPSPASP